MTASSAAAAGTAEGALRSVTAAGDGSCPAVPSDADSDVGLVAYEMTLMVRPVGAPLSTAPRAGISAGG
ncbi:hypothetical protein SCWH03_56420 [Streptomyces pacificus]|uniref:Uncharacterized protein n=1 Tax=Streptomyces pacificus TaxID=2705029 RepID=A0A6A0B3V0_9ACTN|nr:hypothetical protein SCWH03_56420 [Streptomyces pacificus]